MGEFEHRRGLGNGHVVEHTEGPDDEARKQESGNGYVPEVGSDFVASILGQSGQVGEFDCGPRQYGGQQHRCQSSQQCGAGAQTYPVGEVYHRVENGRRRHQRHRQCRCPVAQGRQHENGQHNERDSDTHQRPQSPPAGHCHDDNREDHRQHGQRPGAFVVIEPVAGGALLVDLTEDANPIAGVQIRLAGPGRELQQGLSPGVGPGVDGD